MRLQLDIVHVTKVVSGDTTSVHDGILSVNRQELTELLRDARLAQIDVQLANPGDKCRIVNVADVVEPRARSANSGPDFPGAVGAQGTAGHGTTCVLRGAAVIVSDYNFAGRRHQRADEGFIDMWGPGARAGRYGKTCNVVVLASPANGTSIDEYCLAMKIAGLKTAAYLARAGAHLTPDEVEVYELPPMPQTATDAPRLPRVAYICQLFTNQRVPLPKDPVLYGDHIERIVPTILHPNEILDGAVTDAYRGYAETYVLQNHPIVKELYRNHGKNLYFAGVVISNAPNNAPEYDRAANIAANLAKWILGADGAVLTKIGGGAPELTMARTAERCEALGIKTALAFLHQGMDASEITLKASTIFSNVPKVDAMVSMGTSVASPMLTLPPAEKVVGLLDGSSMAGELRRPASDIKGAFSQLGDSKLMAVRY